MSNAKSSRFGGGSGTGTVIVPPPEPCAAGITYDDNCAVTNVNIDGVDWTPTYDADGRLISITNGATVKNFTYNADGTMVFDYPADTTLTFDADGKPTNVQYTP